MRALQEGGRGGGGAERRPEPQEAPAGRLLASRGARPCVGGSPPRRVGADGSRGRWVPSLGRSDPPHCAAPTPWGPLLSDGLQGLPVGTWRGRPPGSLLSRWAGASRPWPVPQAGQCPSPRALGGGGIEGGQPQAQGSQTSRPSAPLPSPSSVDGGTGLRPCNPLTTRPPHNPFRGSVCQGPWSPGRPQPVQSPPPGPPGPGHPSPTCHSHCLPRGAVAGP